MCVRACVFLEGEGGVGCWRIRGLPADRRGACCFLLGMLLQEFPLDFSCRDQNSGQAGEETGYNGRKSKPAAFPRLFSAMVELKCWPDPLQGCKKSLFIDASGGLISTDY